MGSAAYTTEKATVDIEACDLEQDGYRDSERDRDSRRSRSPSYRSRYPERRTREDYEKKDKGNSTSLGKFFFHLEPRVVIT